jgi:hypothetical protein
MRKSLLTGILAVLLLFSFAAVWPGSAAQIPQIETRVTRVALFKNGLGFFVREGKLPDSRTFKVAPFSAPAHGTFWLSYPQKVGLQSLVAREATTTEDVEVTNTADLLAANVRIVGMNCLWSGNPAVQASQQVLICMPYINLGAKNCPIDRIRWHPNPK